MGHSISEIVRYLGFSKSAVSKAYQEYMDDGQKISDRDNCKGHLAFTVRGLAWEREHRDWSIDDWTRLAWRDESLFGLLNADGRLRIWCQTHEVVHPACEKPGFTRGVMSTDKRVGSGQGRILVNYTIA
ncbi:transposable element Tcb2 transposase [Trichonephila clavipes]|nr:transposable element Tcb2 transposase [Trichonephila clavipes]